MPIPLTLALAPLALQAGKTVYTALNKPKRPENTELMTALERQISNNQSNIVNKTLMNSITKNAKSLGSQMYQKQERSLDVMRSKGDLTEGQYARGLLEAGQGIQEEVGKSQDAAVMAQEDSNVKMQDRIEGARLQLAQMKDAAREKYLGDKQEWGNELAGGILDTATAGFNVAMQSIADKNIQSQVGKILNGRNITDLTPDELTNFATQLQMIKMGISIPDAVQRVAQPTAALVQGAAQPFANKPAPMQLQPATLQAPDLSMSDADTQALNASINSALTPVAPQPLTTPAAPKAPAPAVKAAPVAPAKPNAVVAKTPAKGGLYSIKSAAKDDVNAAYGDMKNYVIKNAKDTHTQHMNSNEIVKEYQRSKGLAETGYVNDETYTAAIKQFGMKSRLSSIDNYISKRMGGRGSGRSKQEKIRAVQIDLGLPATGTLDSATYEAIKGLGF